MKAITAVEWLVKQLLESGLDVGSGIKMSYPISNDIVEQAMEMEEDQIKEAFELGELNENSYQHVGKRIHKDKEEYYNKSYRK